MTEDDWMASPTQWTWVWVASLWTKLVEVMEFQLSYFRSWKMMLWKCCTQYASKFGKLCSGHRTRKDQFLFQSQREAMPKNVPTIMQLCSFYILARLCSKSFKPGFSSTWTVKFQIYKVGFEEAEEPEIKLPTFVGSWRKQGSFIKTSISASLTVLKPLSVRITTKCGKQTGVPDHLTYLLRNLYAGQEATVKTRHGTTD